MKRIYEMPAFRITAFFLFGVALMGMNPVGTDLTEVAYQAPIEAPDMVNKAFQPGERLVFRISYGGWLTAGEAEFNVSPKYTTLLGRKCYVIHGKGNSVGGFNWVYKVQDSFKSYVDAKKLVPYTYQRVVHEGDYEFEDEVWFDHAKQEIRTGKKGNHKMGKLTHDMLSAFYYARCLNLKDFKEGQSYEMPVFLDDKIYNLGLTVLGRETIRTPLGKYKCIKISPKLVTGRVFKEGDEGMVLWVTDDENYIPLRITSPLIVGSVRVELSGYYHLRNPVTSLVR